MRHSVLALLLGLAIFFSPSAAQAQQAGKVWRVALLTGDRPGTAEAFVDGLRELNYVEGRNLIVEYRRFARPDQLPAIAADLVRLNPDVIVVGHGRAAMALKAATRTIPIVLATSADAVAMGLVTSLARPGGNITGLTNMNTDLAAKRLELLTEAAPQASRIAVLGCPELATNGAQASHAWLIVQAAAQRKRLTLVPVFVLTADELPGAFESAMRQKIDGVLVLECSFLPRAEDVTAVVNRSRVPAMYPSPRYVQGGELMSYGPDTLGQYRRAAVFVDKILKGAKPADIPVEQPAKFELAINVRTAKALGLTVPPAFLLRADRVID